MMNWGKKKKPFLATSPSSPHSHSHLISHVFPRSWLSKFKHSSEKHSATQIKKQASEEKSSPKPSLPRDYSNYYKDGDGFWRVKSKTKTNAKEEVVTKKSSSVIELKKVVSRKVTGSEKVKEEILQRSSYNNRILMELDQVNLYTKSCVGETPSRNTPTVPTHSDGKKSDRQGLLLKDAKIKQVLVKTEKQRKSFHMSRASNGVRVSTPRTPLKTESFKIRALEEMKRAKLKQSRAKGEIVDEQERSRAMPSLGSFAIVKRSRNPQQDFKDSMLEMIMAKGITRPQELEELLACYLTLNADEYHHLIVKVFRQVWHELEEQSCSK